MTGRHRATNQPPRLTEATQGTLLILATIAVMATTIWLLLT